MAFIVPRSPLSPRRSLVVGIDERRKVLRADELRALRTAEEAVAAAQAQAEQIVGQAQAIYDAEKRRGHEEGREEARMEQAEQMIENVARNVDYFSKVESRMVDLVMQAVQKIIDDFDDREKVMMTVRNVLSVVRNQKQMTLRLAPTQVEVVKSRVNELLASYPGVGYLDILADSRLQGDACILESEIGLVESSIEGQLQALREAFQKVLGSRVA
jgi:type III secretion protein L